MVLLGPENLVKEEGQVSKWICRFVVSSNTVSKSTPGTSSFDSLFVKKKGTNILENMGNIGEILLTVT